MRQGSKPTSVTETLQQDLEAVLRALAQLYAARGDRQKVRMIAHATPRLAELDNDGWNGGTYYYQLSLEVPVQQYAGLEPSRIQVEEQIRKDLEALTAAYVDERIVRVSIGVPIKHDDGWRARAISWAAHPKPDAKTASSSVAPYDFFVSHASEDKEPVVIPLVNELCRLGARVWYDEFELRVGTRLRRSIDKGLTNCKYGVVVLSPSFFGKNWPEYELDGLTAREMGVEDLLLPIWHDVTREDVARRSPSLADRLALSTANQSLEEIASRLFTLLQSNEH